VAEECFAAQGQGSHGCESVPQSGIHGFARILFLMFASSVSQAVRSTKRGARCRMVIKYGTVRLASAFAVSRSSQPKPFWTMSSSSCSSELDKRLISAKNIFRRVPWISATQAARRCQRSRDFAQRKTRAARAGLAAIIGAIR